MSSVTFVVLRMEGNGSLRITYSNTQLGLVCTSVTNLFFSATSFILLWTCHWAFTGPVSQQCYLSKNRLLTSIKLCLIMLQYYRLMVMNWNNVMPPTRLACSTCMNACGVTDVVCHSGLHCLERACFCMCDFMYNLCVRKRVV